MKASPIFTHLAAAAVITMVIGLVYVAVQQNYRGGANEIQAQVATEISNRLQKNQSIEKLWPDDTIELTRSLRLFIELYDANKQPVATTALLNGSIPEIPHGVMEIARINNENRITWMPQSDVRMAMVVQHVNSPHAAYVAVGRSLKEVEMLEHNLLQMVFICWIMCIGVIIIHFVIAQFLQKKQ